MEDSLITLSTDQLRLTLAPRVGGAVAGFEWIENDRKVPILRESPEQLANVLEAASFPLVPFVNRIRGGSFDFRGREIRLAPNMAGDPSPLHGQGWTSAWSVESASADEAVLAFQHQPGEWPWRFESRQHFRLAGDALRMRLTCRNLSDEPMPCGLGIHPYFPCGSGTRIQTHVKDVWTVDEHVLPIERVVATGRYAIADDPVCGRGLDNGYGEWSGRALLTDPGWPFEIELSSPQARFFQLYSPERGGIFVAEPVTHANGALNEPDEHWAELGLRILSPGEEMALDSRLAVQVWSGSVG